MNNLYLCLVSIDCTSLNRVDSNSMNMKIVTADNPMIALKIRLVEMGSFRSHFAKLHTHQPNIDSPRDSYPLINL